MPKALCITGMAIAAVVALLFGLDLIAALAMPSLAPFNGVSKFIDIAFLICSLILGFLSFTTFREQE